MHGADQRGHAGSSGPRPRRSAGDAPAHGGQPPRRADADDRAGDRVRGRDRDAEVRGDEERRRRRAVSAANPPTGCSFVIFEPMVWTMRQPPDERAEADRGVRGEHDPDRNRGTSWMIVRR